MKGGKCKNCGGGEIDTDPARGDAVCTNCGSVLESNIIVATVQFEERAAGAVSVLGQFVSSESKGAPRGLGPNFQSGFHTESRELTLSKAKKKITQLAQILRVNQTCIDMAFNFFKMALNRQLTRGRRTENVIGACLYMTCRLEGTPHMLIDFCDALDIGGVYTLGRTFLRLATALCIKVPTPDPSLYVMRFAGALAFGKKTHAVTVTALRLIARMKRDSIHTGRHASGLCGAALLMAARLHDFNRTVNDIVSIVKVHESTLRKRLMEFGETPSSLLSLDEFMTVDLEEEQDPPSFRAARKKDRGITKIPNSDELDQRFIALQAEIEKELKKTRKRPRFFAGAVDSIDTMALEATVEELSRALEEPHQGGIPPTYETLRLDRDPPPQDTASNASSDDLTGLDDEELDAYILTPDEVKFKNQTWMSSNADFLEKEKEREELRKAKEATKPDRKKKRGGKKGGRSQPIAGSAFEAIEKMLQEKKLSNKINYEVLKNLTLPEVKPKEEVKPVVAGPSSEPEEKRQKKDDEDKTKEDEVIEEDVEEDVDEVPVENTEMSLADMLSQHRNDDDDADDYIHDMDEDDY